MINEEVHILCEESIFQISTKELTFESIRNETRKDEYLSKILQELCKNNNTKSEFTIDSDIVFKGQRVVIPATTAFGITRAPPHTH